MNDRLKFRVRCKSTKRFISKKASILFLGNYMRHPNDTVFNDFIIEQCTGLKDKNGVLIYEGDLCLRKDAQRCAIVFYANGWCMDMSLYYPMAREGWCENILGTPELEIIGNIHENPELLEA